MVNRISLCLFLLPFSLGAIAATSANSSKNLNQVDSLLSALTPPPGLRYVGLWKSEHIIGGAPQLVQVYALNDQSAVIAFIGESGLPSDTMTVKRSSVTQITTQTIPEGL